MNSKRIKFALFISVFALYGCASGSKSDTISTTGAANITKINEKSADATAFHTTEMMNNNDNVMAMVFQANDPSTVQQFSTLLQSRSADGTLRTQTAMKTFSVKVPKDIKKKQQEEKARKEKKAREAAASTQTVTADSNAGGGRTFTPKTTTYGVDCYGCGGEDGRGGTSIGVALDADLGVQMPDGSWQPGIRYGQYYIIAADPSIPLCSIIKISNHGLSGAGMSPNQPYYAIVLDRGGAIYGSHLDLYVGRENSGLITKVKRTTPKAEIIRLGGKSGPRSCSL